MVKVNGVFALAAAALATTLFVSAPVRAAMSPEELAKLAQNPVGDLISVPFQNNTNFNVGPLQRHPEHPEHPAGHPGRDQQGLEHHHPHHRAGYLAAPAVADDRPHQRNRRHGIQCVPVAGAAAGLIWGVGPVVQLPTNTSDELGNKNWGLGPTFVVLHLELGNPWVYGVLANNLWSLSSSKQGGSYNNGLIQPFVNYNFTGGLYLVSGPILTVDWKADSGQQWTVPLGGGIGKIFHIGKLPVNTSLQAYYNVVHPDNGANWQLRAQVQFMFPK